MRIDRDRLTLLALAVLKSALGRLHGGALKPGPDVRLALAVLFSFSRSGERDDYDTYWRNLSDPMERAFSEQAARHLRMMTAHTLFERIARDVGTPADVDYRSRIGTLVLGPTKQPWRPGSAFDRPISSAVDEPTPQTDPAEHVQPLQDSHDTGRGRPPVRR